MFTRYQYLQNNMVLADAGEVSVPIGTNDKITRLSVTISAQNGATNNKANVIPDNVSAIELVDGSNVILSATGKELAGILAGRMNTFPNMVISELPGVTQSYTWLIDFGRWYNDPNVGLDASRFKNLQLRIIWNLATIRATGATGFVSGTGRLTVLAHIVEGGSDYGAYLGIKRHALFTTAASGEASIDLPTDKTVRAIALRCHEAGVGGLSGLSYLKLQGDEGKIRPIDLTVQDFLDHVVNTYSPIIYHHDFHTLDAETVYCLLKYREHVTLIASAQDIIGQYQTTGIGEGVVEAETASTGVALAAATPFYGKVTGYLPFSTALYTFGDWSDPNTWFDATVYKTLRFILGQNNAGANASVLLETLNLY